MDSVSLPLIVEPGIVIEAPGQVAASPAPPIHSNISHHAPVLASRVMTSPRFILVIPYEKTEKGWVWGAYQSWATGWTAPVRVGRFQLILLAPDANDMDILGKTPSSDGISVNAMSRLGAKYGVPSVMTIGLDDQGSHVHLLGGSPFMVSTHVKANIFTEIASYISDSPRLVIQPGDDGGGVDVAPEPALAEEGQFGFSLIYDSDPEELRRIRRVVSSMEGVEVQNSMLDQEGLEIKGRFAGNQDEFMKALMQAGLPVPRS
jgi:hypothetical protein